MMTRAYYTKGLILLMNTKIIMLVIALCSLVQFSVKADDSLEFSGYARLIGGYFDKNDVEYEGYDDSVNFSPSSLIAFQLDYELTDSLFATGQIILTDNDTSENNSTGLEWLYLTYQPTDSLQLKLGKLRTPFFSMSDFSNVGFAYPWINLPQQVYNTYLFDTFTGIDVIYKFSGDKFDASIEGYFGQDDGKLQVGNINTAYEVDNLAGIIGKINIENLEFRIAKYNADTNLELPDLKQLETQLRSAGFVDSANTVITEGKAQAKQFGIIYDNLDYFFRGEWIKIDTDFEIVPSIQSYYLTAGFNYAPFTYHLTYANSDVKTGSGYDEIPLDISDDLDQLAAAYQFVFADSTPDALESWTIGARWDVLSNVALKVEVSKLEGQDGENSFFESSSEAEFSKEGNLYLIGFEWVF
jgi:hypothetical protein